jgi:predicted small metal-binding protein
VKRFSCGDVIPGCHRVFSGADDQSVLDQVLAHAAADHGLIEPPMALVELVVAHTYPSVPVRERAHLRVVDTPARRCSEPVAAVIPVSPADPGADGHGPETLAPVTPLAGNRTRLAGRGHRREHRPPAATARSEHDSYRHECVMYRGERGFVEAVVPFIRDGLARDEPVLVAVIEPRQRALRAALGPDADQVLFADMAELGHNPARIIPAWREFTHRHGEQATRGVGEPIWAGRRAAEIVECQFHEALLNVAVPPETPLWLICPYDTESLDDDVIGAARQSHPVVTDRGSDVPSAEYGGDALIRNMFAAPLPEPMTRTLSIGFDGCRHQHIGDVRCGAEAAGLPADRAAGLAVAVSEVSTTAFGCGGPERIRLWSEPGAVICDITGAATFDNPLVGRSAVIAPDRRERGIRLANALCDLVQVRSGPEGGTVRLHHWISLAPASR